MVEGGIVLSFKDFWSPKKKKMFWSSERDKICMKTELGY